MVPLTYSKASINAAKRKLPQEEVLLSVEHILQASLTFPQEETQSSPVGTINFHVNFLLQLLGENNRTKIKIKS